VARKSCRYGIGCVKDAPTLMHFIPTSSSWLNMVELFFRGPEAESAAPRRKSLV